MSPKGKRHGKAAPKRVRILLVAQDYQCADCQRPIDNSRYFDCGHRLICGRCALPKFKNLLW
jgi:hypothetical protein